MGFFTIVLWFLVAISILVTFHEFGHYWVARRCGVRVLRFSLGIGPVLYGWKNREGTEFALSAIPIGGYVKMLDEREAEVAEDERHLSYNSKSVGQRIAIAAAGPIANVILAWALYWVVFAQGMYALLPVLGPVEAGTPAAVAGIEAGGTIVAVDGQSVADSDDVAAALTRRLGESGDITLSVKYNNAASDEEFNIPIEHWLSDIKQPDPMSALGLNYKLKVEPAKIAEVIPGHAGDRAGLKAGDVITAVNGKSIESAQQLTAIIRANPGRKIDLSVRRDGSERDLTLVPETVNISGRQIGMAQISLPAAFPDDMVVHSRPGVLRAFAKAGTRVKDDFVMVFVLFKKLLIAEISVKNLSGPVGIAKVAAGFAEHGVLAFTLFLANLSVLLAAMNLLPVPVLDGGHILYCVVEWIKGRPLSERAQIWGFKIGLTLLLCMMMVAFYNDMVPANGIR